MRSEGRRRYPGGILSLYGGVVLLLVGLHGSEFRLSFSLAGLRAFSLLSAQLSVAGLHLLCALLFPLCEVGQVRLSLCCLRSSLFLLNPHSLGAKPSILYIYPSTSIYTFRILIHKPLLQLLWPISHQLSVAVLPIRIN